MAAKKAPAKRKGPGRPKLGTMLVQFKVPTEVYDRGMKKSAAQGETLSGFARRNFTKAVS